MKSTNKSTSLGKRLTKIAAAASLAFAAAAPQLAHADAVAQSILNVFDFKFRVANGAVGEGSSIVGNPNVTITAAATTSDVLASLAGFATSTTGPSACVGSGCGAYSPGTALLGAPTATYSGSTSIGGGDAVTGAAFAGTDNTVSLAPTGDGTAQGNVNLGASFNINVSSATALELSFGATSFLRAMIDKLPGNATAAHNWSITIRNSLGATVFSWSPNGLTGGIAGGTEYADAFNLNDTVSQLFVGNTQVSNAPGYFEAETLLLAAGSYNLSLRHSSFADAVLLPEPGSLALIGAGVFGLGWIARRRKQK